MKFNITKNKIIVFILIILMLIGAYWYGGNAPGLQGFKINNEEDNNVELVLKEDEEKEEQEKKELKGIEENLDDKKPKEIEENNEEQEKNEQKLQELQQEIEKSEEIESKEKKIAKPGAEEGSLSASEKVKLAKGIAGGSSVGIEKGSIDYSEASGMEIDKKTGKDKYLTDPVPEGKPVPVEPQNTKISDIKKTCTLSVRCDTILDNMDWLDKEKHELVPEDGVIYATKTISFYEGESVFNVLLREMKKNKIHMEFSNTPMYNSVYIEGINNLYEFDCGELSGWMYKVNDWFPNYGCSRYQLKEGDVIEWVYTCNLGVDVGGYSAMGGE